MGVGHGILLLALLEFLRGVDEEDVAAGTVLLEDDDAGRDGCVVEEVGRQANDGVDAARAEELLADLALGGAAEQDAVREDDGHGAAALQVVEAVQEEGVVGLGFRREDAVVAVTLILQEAFGGAPFGGVRRIHQDQVEVGLLVGRPVAVQRVGVPEVLILSGDAVEEHVHPGEVVRRGVELLAIIADVIRLRRVAFGVEEQRPRAHARVYQDAIFDTMPVCGISPETA